MRSTDAGGLYVEKAFDIGIGDVAYTVIFDVEGNTTKTSVDDDSGKVSKPSDPVKAGYQFVNWFTENTFKNVFHFCNATITANTTPLCQI